MAKVRKVMLTDVPTLKKDAIIGEAAKLLVQKGHDCVIVVEGKKPIGIVTELDLVMKINSGKINFKEPVSKIMSSPVTFMTPDMELDEALKIIDTRRFRRYPVVENDKLIGFVTKNNIVHAISDNLKLHRAMQNIILIIFVVFELFVLLLYEPLFQRMGA